MGLFSTNMTDKSEDNIETLSPEIVDILKSFVESIELPFSDAYVDKTEDIEWQSRDGFIAYNSTRGGFDRIAIIPTHYLTGSGEIQGLVCQERIETQDANDSDMTLTSMVSTFGHLKSNSDITIHEIDRVLTGQLTDEYNTNQIFNIMTWYALESVAYDYQSFKEESN